MKKVVLWALGGLVASIALIIASGEVVVLRVRSASMQPTYCMGDYLLVRPVSSLAAQASLRDRAIVFSQAGHGLVTKRIVGLAGDELHYTPHRLWRNDRLVADFDSCPAKWVPRDTPVNNRTYQVPNGFVFLLGDNFGQSEDSRAYGAVPIESVVGTVYSSVSFMAGDCGCGYQAGAE